MKGALIILIVTVAAGIVLYVMHIVSEKRNKGTVADSSSSDSEVTGPGCCGLHITCEKDSLLQGVSTKIVYYDDEELDEYKGMKPDDYTDGQIEQFREVLLTLLPEDIAGWVRSLQLRGIELPEIVREEMLLLVAEARAAKTGKN